jgi:putative transposase
MNKSITTPESLQLATELAVDLFDNWFDPIETEVRARSRQFIEELIRSELDAALSRPRYGRSQMAGNEAKAGVTGHRHGSRKRSLTGTFEPIEIAVPRARLTTSEGAEALIAGSYLAGTNTRRVRRALAALFGGTVGKDTVSRTWRKVLSASSESRLAPAQERLDSFLVVLGQARQRELVDVHMAREIVQRVCEAVDGQLGHGD